jgi:hypothetical protein
VFRTYVDCFARLAELPTALPSSNLCQLTQAQWLLASLEYIFLLILATVPQIPVGCGMDGKSHTMWNTSQPQIQPSLQIPTAHQSKQAHSILKA